MVSLLLFFLTIYFEQSSTPKVNGLREPSWAPVTMGDLIGELERRTGVPTDTIHSYLDEQECRHGLWIFHCTYTYQEDFDAHADHLQSLDEYIASLIVGETRFSGIIVAKGLVRFKDGETKDDVINILNFKNYGARSHRRRF